MVGDRLKQVSVRYTPKDLRELGYSGLFESIERFTVLSALALMPEKTAIIVNIRWKGDPDLSWMDSSPLIDKVIDLGDVQDGRIYLLLGSEEPWFFDMFRLIMEEMRVFIDPPVILEADSISVRYVGFLSDISRLMELSRQWNPDHKVLSIKDYDPTRTGIMESLTSVQYDYLLQAYRSGYFDDRRGISLKELARRNGVSVPSFMMTIRRAIRKVLSSAIERRTPEGK